MSASLVSTIALYAGALCAWAALDAVRGRGSHPVRSAGLAVLELALVLNALLGAVGLLSGDRPAGTATYAGYLIASPLVLPVVLSAATAPHAGWHAAVTAVACLAVVVVALRLHATAP